MVAYQTGRKCSIQFRFFPIFCEGQMTGGLGGQAYYEGIFYLPSFKKIILVGFLIFSGKMEGTNAFYRR
jgi:hypothetical protein